MDSSVFGRSGTLTDGATSTTGKFGSGVLLNGSTDYVSIGRFTPFEVVTAWTYVAWAKPSSVTNGVNNCVFSYGKVGDAIQELMLENSFWRMATQNGALSYNGVGTGTPEAVIGRWDHVAVTSSAAGAMKLYVGGVERATLTHTTKAGDSTFYLRIGQGTYSNTETLRFFAGVIDDARVYNRELSATEIAALFNKENSMPNELSKSYRPGPYRPGMAR